ncbi:alpha-N-acetylgalactosaminide alpha-2,6-sialyltransferase 1-like [Diadema antillarum]
MLRQLPLEEPRFPSNIDNVPVNKLPFLKDTSLPKSTCPKTLRSISRTSRWFGERFMEDIKLFSDYDDIRGYQNFHKLQHYRLPFGYRGVDRKQLAAMTTNSNFTNLPLFLLEERPQCLRCAVVGSGGILNGSNVGVEIDSHDLVFRLNRGLAGKRFAKDVGEKTSVYVFFPESLYPSAVKDKDTLAVFAMFKQYDVDYAEHMVREIPPPLFKTSSRNYTLPKPPVSASRLKLLHPDFARYVFTRFLNGKSFRPTTGALVTLLAIHICDEVTLYGFGYDPRFTLHFYDHAFVKHTKASTGAHDVDNERELWKKMHEEGIIRLYRRD